MAWLIHLGAAIKSSVAFIKGLARRDDQLEELRRSERVPIATVCDGQIARLAGKLRLNVRGLCHWEPDPDPRMFREAARRLVVTAPPDGEMIVTDKKL